MTRDATGHHCTAFFDPMHLRYATHLRLHTVDCTSVLDHRGRARDWQILRIRRGAGGEPHAIFLFSCVAREQAQSTLIQIDVQVLMVPAPR